MCKIKKKKKNIATNQEIAHPSNFLIFCNVLFRIIKDLPLLGKKVPFVTDKVK